MQVDGSIRTYSAENSSVSIGRSLVTAWRELRDTREVIWRLFFREAVAGSRERLMGHTWAIIRPIIGMTSFLLLNSAGVLSPGELDIPYPIFLFFSMSLWTMLVGTVTTVGGGLLVQRDLVLRTSVPKIALALSGLPNFLCTQLVNGVILFVLMVALGVFPSWLAMAVPVMILPLLGLGIGIGLILAVFSAQIKDATGVITAILNLLMYVTPVIYIQKPLHPFLQIVLAYNPLTYLIASPRELFFQGDVLNAQAFIIASVFCSTVFFWGIHGFYVIQDKVAERL